MARLVLGFALLSWPSASRAEGARPHVVKLPTVSVTGRIQTPLAAVEVSRALPVLTLTELRPAFADRIAQAIGRDPY